MVVAGNLVVSISRCAARGEAPPLGTNLEAASLLAAGFRASGSIDGHYDFDSLPRARIFAQLCLEFTRALADRRLAAIGRLSAGAEYRAGDGGEAQP